MNEQFNDLRPKHAYGDKSNAEVNKGPGDEKWKPVIFGASVIVDADGVKNRQILTGRRHLGHFGSVPFVDRLGQRSRSNKRGNILMVTFPGRFSPMDAANFQAEVMDENEIADMLLMVLTFDPDK